jgi:hypothetical protein
MSVGPSVSLCIPETNNDGGLALTKLQGYIFSIIRQYIYELDMYASEDGQPLPKHAVCNKVN